MSIGNLLLQTAPSAITPPQFRTLQIATDFLQAQSLYVVTKLSVADYLKDEVRSIEELAKLTGTHSESLCRLMRFMASFGYFEEVDPELCSFRNNKHSEILMASHARTMKDVVLHMSDHYENFVNLLDTVKEGAQTEKSKKYWSNLELDSTKRGIFARAMMQITRMESEVITTDYNFAQYQRIADIGGGTGIFLSYLLRKHLHLDGLLFDLPNVIQDARSIWKTNHTDVINRVEFQGGDFFKSIPSTTGDKKDIEAYIMRSVLHDWDNEACVTILKVVRAAIPRNSKLLLVEIVFDEPTDHDVVKRRSDTMMQIVGGKERSKSQFEEILRKGGFKLSSVVPTRSHHSVVEACPI
jgi:hypothetical protein